MGEKRNNLVRSDPVRGLIREGCICLQASQSGVSSFARCEICLRCTGSCLRRRRGWRARGVQRRRSEVRSSLLLAVNVGRAGESHDSTCDCSEPNRNFYISRSPCQSWPERTVAAADTLLFTRLGIVCQKMLVPTCTSSYCRAPRASMRRSLLAQ